MLGCYVQLQCARGVLGGLKGEECVRSVLGMCIRGA